MVLNVMFQRYWFFFDDLLENMYVVARNINEKVRKISMNQNQATPLVKLTAVAITWEMPMIAKPRGKPRKLFSPVSRYGFIIYHTRTKQIIAEKTSASSIVIFTKSHISLPGLVGYCNRKSYS